MAAARSIPRRAFCGFTFAIALLLVQSSHAADGGYVYAGKVSWLKDPTRDGEPVHDAMNEDLALRDRPILGLAILSGFKFTGAATWAGGELYAPRNGKSFPAVLTLTPDGRLQVKVSAGIVRKTVYWTR